MENDNISNSYILGCGEYLSTIILHNYLKSVNIDSYLADTSKFISSLRDSSEIKDLYMSGDIRCDNSYLENILSM